LQGSPKIHIRQVDMTRQTFRRIGPLDVTHGAGDPDVGLVGG
jgi:hypothetical protein